MAAFTMRRLPGVVGVAVLGACLVPTAAARELFVDPQGLGGICDDRGTGASTGTPLCTLAECLARAVQPGDRCWLREGRYAGSAVPLADGRPEAPIAVARYGTEQVEIWGALPLDGPWRSESDEVFTLETGVARPLALLETAPDGVEITYGAWTPLGRRSTRTERMAPGSFTWEAGESSSTLKLRRARGGGDPNASAWRARIAELDLRERRWVTFEGIAFVDMNARLEGAADVRFDDCRFGPAGEEQRLSPEALDDPLAPPTTPSSIGDPPQAGQLVPTQGEVGGDEFLPEVLGIELGGTGSGSPAGARTNLQAAWDGDVVHLNGNEMIFGTKTFNGAVVIRELNGVKRSTGFATIADCVASLAPTGGVCLIDPSEDDATSFVDANPDLRPYSLVRDARGGGVRWLSSRPEPGTGATEDEVPFVFQVRWNDASRTYDDEPGAVGEWNCGLDAPGASDEWRNCPTGHVTKGSGSDIQPFWHTGQCNANSSAPSMRCGGPHILEVRYPDVPGYPADKPIFAVGSSGASIFMPDFQDEYYQSALTIFRGRSTYWSQDTWNTPMFAFDKGGLFADGGSFVGNTLAWPAPYSSHLYEPYNLWVQHDVGFDYPAFVVEGPSDGSDPAQRSPLARFYDRSGKATYNHPGMAREAFGFYSDSRLYLGSFRNSDRGGQVIEWEGSTVDANTTRVGVAEPTAPRTITLPDMDGYVALASSGSTKLTCGEVSINPPAAPMRTTVTATAAAPVASQSACACTPRGDWHDDLIFKGCIADEEFLTFRFYNADNASIPDGDTSAIVVDYCCTSK